jgi:hypothetical protein
MGKGISSKMVFGKLDTNTQRDKLDLYPIP